MGQKSPGLFCPTFIATFETGRHYKVHKSYIYVAPLLAVAAVLAVSVLNGMQGIVQLIIAIQDGGFRISPLLIVGIAVLALAVLVGALIGLYALAWKNMSYVFDEREFSYYSGIITKRRVHVPYARVQSVNHRASVVQRLVGVCTVTIDSAGGSSNKGVHVPYLRLETAERLRAELFMRKAAVAAGAEGAVVYMPAADPDSAEGAQVEAAREAQLRGRAPEAPTRSAAVTAAGFSVPGQRIVAPPAQAGGESGALEGVDAAELAAAAVDAADAAADVAADAVGRDLQPSAPWTCPQCGKAANTGSFCSDCGLPAPVFAQACNTTNTQLNALDAAVGDVGDWRGVYGGAAAFGEEPVSYEYGLTNRELALTTVSHDTPIVVALVVGLTFVAMLAFVLLVQDEVALAIAAFTVPIIVASTLVTWAFGMVAVLLSYGNFRARRRGSRIEVERGLLAREFSGIDLERVQSIEIRQSFIRRLIGYCEVSLGRIDAAGEQDSGNNNSKANTKGLVIHPFVKLDRVDEILDGLAPELADRPRRADCAPLPKPALRRALLRRCVWYNWVLWITVVVGVCWGIIGVLVSTRGIVFASAAARAQYEHFMVGSLALVVVVCAVFTIGRAVGAVLWARHSGYAWNRRYLLLVNDGLSTAQSIIPRQKIQSAATRANPFQRRLALVTLQAVTAAGTRSTTARLVDVSADAGAAYLDWLKPRS